MPPALLPLIPNTNDSSFLIVFLKLRSVLLFISTRSGLDPLGGKEKEKSFCSLIIDSIFNSDCGTTRRSLIYKTVYLYRPLGRKDKSSVFEKVRGKRKCWKPEGENGAIFPTVSFFIDLLFKFVSPSSAAAAAAVSGKMPLRVRRVLGVFLRLLTILSVSAADGCFS